MEAHTPAERRSRLIAIGLMFAALICFSCLDATAKWLNQSIPPMQTVWLRYILSVVFVSLVINPVTTPGLLRTKRPGLQAVRSILLFLSTAFNFFAIRELQLAQTVSIQFANPFIVALIAGPLIGEWIGPRRLIAVAIGFVGVLIIARPSIDGLPPAMWLAFGGTVAYALYQIATRVLAAHDSSQTTMFYSGVAGVLIVTPLIFMEGWTALSWSGWAIAALMGFLGAFGHWLLILAHRRAPASILAPFIYTQIVWMVLLGYFVFGDFPDRYTILGASIVIASGLYLLYRERVRGVDLN